MNAKLIHAPTKRVNLYRLHELESLVEGFSKTYDHLDETTVSIDGRAGLLKSGVLGGKKASWTSDIAMLTGQSLDLVGHTPGAALIWSDSNGQHWAISWGSGFHFLRNDLLDFEFGSKVLVRTADPSSVRSLTKTILDHRSRVDRSSLPLGDNISALGVDGLGEVVSRIEAKGLLSELTYGNRQILLKASDSLNLPLGKTAANVARDVSVLSRTLKLRVKPGLEAVEQLTAVRNNNPIITKLNRQLAEALTDSTGSTPVGIGWPHERLDLYGPVAAYKATGFGQGNSPSGEDLPGLEEIRGWIAGLAPDKVIARLGEIQISLYNDTDVKNEHRVSRNLPAYSWLAFEAQVDAQRYCLHDGRWYLMDQNYFERIQELVDEVFSTAASIALPPWDLNEFSEEKHYNKEVARQLSGVLLDRELIPTPLHKRGIEPCDIYVHSGVLIHVKRAESSSAISHLLAQGLISTESLRRDESARIAFVERVRKLTSNKIRSAKVSEVVLAFARRDLVTQDSLFSFSKVNLVRQVQYLKSLDVKVSIATIPLQS